MVGSTHHGFRHRSEIAYSTVARFRSCTNIDIKLAERLGIPFQQIQQSEDRRCRKQCRVLAQNNRNIQICICQKNWSGRLVVFADR